MKSLGQPFVVQNTDLGWQVTWTDAITHGTEAQPDNERVSFTVMLPKRAELTIAELQTFALKRAAELLQVLIRHRTDAGQ